jgi:hypothetical protein
MPRATVDIPDVRGPNGLNRLNGQVTLKPDHNPIPIVLNHLVSGVTLRIVGGVGQADDISG